MDSCHLNRAPKSFVYVEWVDILSHQTQECMKLNDLDGYDNRRAFARRQLDRLIDGIKAGDTTNRFAMLVFWLVLGAACAALGFVLFTILLR